MPNLVKTHTSGAVPPRMELAITDPIRLEYCTRSSSATTSSQPA